MAKKKDDGQKNLQKYLTRIEAAEKYRDNGYKERWKRCYKRWRNHMDAIIDPETGKIAQRSNIGIPYTFTQVETILPRLVETLFASRPYVAVKDREPTDLPNAQKNETLLDWQMNERMDIKDTFYDGLKGLCIYGTAITFTGWKYQTKEIIKKMLQPVKDEYDKPILDEVTGQPIQDYQLMRVKETVYDDPEVYFVDLGLFFVDPAATGIEDARYCGHVSYMTKKELQNKEELGLFKLDWKKIPKDGNKGNKARDERMTSVGLPTFDDQGSEDADDVLYEVHHYWEDDKYVAIINRAYMACDTDNPYWHKKKPYDKAVYTIVPGEFYGIGIPEICEDLQDELNVERNQRIDYRTRTMQRMYKVRKGSEVDKNQVRWRPNGIVYVDDMDDIAEFLASELPASSFSEENTIKQDMQDATGAHDVVMGTADNKETATTTMTKDNNASMRFKLIISSMEKRLLAGVSRKIVQNNQQFIDTERWLRVTGENGDGFDKISPEEIQGEFDFICMGSSVEPLANKEAFKQRMVEMYSIASKDPIYQQFPDKRMALLKKVFEAFDIKDIDSVLPTDQEMQQKDKERQLLDILMKRYAAEGQTQPGQAMPGETPMMPEGGAANTAAMAEQGLGGGAY